MLSLEGVVTKIFGTRSDRWLKKRTGVVGRINALEPAMQKLDDAALRGQTARFRQQLDNGAPLDDLLPEAFATVREVSRRVMGMRHFDVQLQGGLVLHEGMVAEMKTGEGKTLTATLAVYLNALPGKGVHVVTVNDYLASRDADWMGRIYRYLGLSVGKILQADREQDSKKRAYAADITYGTNNEFGFDYLRDNMKFRIEEYVQRGHHYAIVDEVDSILIDEARTPLIISGPSSQDVDKYVIIDGVIPLLQADIDWQVDEKARSVNLTDAGVDRVEEKLGIDNLFAPNNMELLHHVTQALKAHTVFRRDRDYVVQNGKVVIVDENTGRLMPGRRWSDGLHQAVEAKEKVRVERESQTYATITFQNYFRMYTKLSGMTGTADTEREEFQKIYNLDVMVVPTNRPVLRKDHDDVVYKTQAEKYRAILDEIEQVHASGQPILVGTVSVEKSEIVSRLLRQRGITHEVLNARNHEREAQIVAQAGHKGSVTISTNMAGRGTDIKLGGDPEAMAAEVLGPQHTADELARAAEQFKAQCEAEKAEVIAAGGLHIIGTERHESRRIDNQLRGRSGRQGDPGSSRFYMALDDDLLRIFQGDKLVGWMEKMGLQDDEAIEHRWINKSIEDAQRRVEGHNFQIRKNLLEYDDVMNLQRRTIYEMRRKALMGEQVREMMLEIIDNLVDDVMGECIPDGVSPEQWNIGELRAAIERVFTLRWDDTDDELRDHAYDELRSRLRTDAVRAYEAKEGALGPEAARQSERMLLLQNTDDHWKDHLLAMQRLRQGVGLRGYGQKNPLLEYKKEGTEMFRVMCSLRDEAVLSRLLRMEGPPADLGESEVEDEAPPAPPRPALPTLAEVQARLAAFAAAAAARSALPPDDADDEALTDEADLDDVDAPAEGPAEEEVGADELPAAPPPVVAPAPPPRAAAPAPVGPPAGFRPAPGPQARAIAELNDLKRNDPCPCGSGKKFKKCCSRPEADPPDAAPVPPELEAALERLRAGAADEEEAGEPAGADPSAGADGGPVGDGPVGESPVGDGPVGDGPVGESPAGESPDDGAAQPAAAHDLGVDVPADPDAAVADPAAAEAHADDAPGTAAPPSDDDGEEGTDRFEPVAPDAAPDAPLDFGNGLVTAHLTVDLAPSAAPSADPADEPPARG